MKRIRNTQAAAAAGRLGVGARRAVPVTNLAGLTHQLALMRAASAAAEARHSDDLQTIAKAYRVLCVEHAELKARHEAAEQLAEERLFHLQRETAAAAARLEKLQVERDALARTARDARESAAKLSGQLAASRGQVPDHHVRKGPSSVTPRPARVARAPLVPRVITTPRGASKKAGSS